MRRTRDERGAATAELVVATPALLFVLLVVVHVGLWFHASHVASAAAQEGARVARNEGGTPTAGEAAAESLLAELGSNLVIGGDAVVSAAGSDVRAVVTGHAPEVVPFVRLPIRAVSEGPVERFRAADE